MDRSRTETILNSIADGVFTVNEDFKITSFNRAAASITGFKKDEAIGQYCREVFRTSACIGHCPIRANKWSDTTDITVTSPAEDGKKKTRIV